MMALLNSNRRTLRNGLIIAAVIVSVLVFFGMPRDPGAGQYPAGYTLYPRFIGGAGCQSCRSVEPRD